MKKLMAFGAVALFLIPQITFAAWWNPSSWSIWGFIFGNGHANTVSLLTNGQVVTVASTSRATTTMSAPIGIKAPKPKGAMITPSQTVQDPDFTDRNKFEAAYKTLARAQFDIGLYLINPKGDPTMAPYTSELLTERLSFDEAQIEAGMNTNNYNEILVAARDAVSIIKQIQSGIDSMGMQYVQQAEVNLQVAADNISKPTARSYAEMVASFAPSEVAGLYKLSTDTKDYYNLLLGDYSTLVSDGGDYSMASAYWQNQNAQIQNAKNAINNDGRLSASNQQMSDAYKNFESAYQ